MTRFEPARRLTIHLGHADHFHVGGHTRHTPLGTELLFRAHRAGLRGATLLQGVEGYGGSNRIHHTPTWGLVDRAPVILLIVDTAARIDAFVEANGELFSECLATVSEVRLRVPQSHHRADSAKP